MNRRQFDQLFQDNWPVFAQVIDSVIADFLTQVQVDVLEAAITSGDPDRVYRVLFFNPATFNPIQDVMQDIINIGGSAELATVPALRNPDGPGRLNTRFDGRNPRADTVFVDDPLAEVLNLLGPDGEQLALNEEKQPVGFQLAHETKLQP